MKQIASCTDINLNDRKISNHSGRKTLVQILKRLNLSNAECMASSRHKSEQGLARYERPELEMQYNNAMKLSKVFGFGKKNDDNLQSGQLLFFDTFIFYKVY